MTVRNIREICISEDLSQHHQVPPQLLRGDPLRRQQRTEALRAQSEDEGNYACRASNGYNEAEDRVDITVLDLQVQESVWTTLTLPTAKKS